MQNRSSGKREEVELRYLPSRDLKAKYNANKLAILENSVGLTLAYDIEYLEEAASLTIVARKPRLLDIEVLHSCAAAFTVVDIIPHFCSAKILEFSLEPFGLSFCAFSGLHLNK